MKTKKTLKKRINHFLLKNEDICCETDVDRKIIIEQLFELYEKIAEFYNEKDLYLDYVNNDIVSLVGIKIDLVKQKDKTRSKLWDEIDKKCFKNKKVDKLSITKLLNEVPLYFLLSFLGMGYYKYKVQEDNFNINQPN